MTGQMLAALLLHPNDPVPMSSLIETIWEDHPPRDARNMVHGCVSRLRKLFAAAGGPRDVIVTEPAGYRVQADPRNVDLCEFRRLRDEARAAAAAGHSAGANQRYRAALALWRGSALAGVDAPLVRQAAAVVDEERVQTFAECLEIELAHGLAGELVPELIELVRQHPYQERLHAALMLALYRAGRQADALAAYREAHRLLRDELGVEPGNDLQRLHQAVLSRDPELDTPRQAPQRPADDRLGGFKAAVPRTLPPDIRDFVGRDKLLIQVRDSLAGHFGSAVPVVVITGPAGVGKTALSVHLAHQLLDEYPDGQLYVNLRGLERDPAGPFEVLGRFLRALGVDAALADTLDERGELYRNLLFGQRVLVVLDNAASDDQVVPLIPGDHGCGVIVNSRTRLGSSFSAEVLTVATLNPSEASSMIAHIVGPERVHAEPEAVSVLAQLCGHLPLAVRVAAGQLATRPHWSVRRLTAQLRDERRRLDHLARGMLDVRASITLSYASLSAEGRCLLRRVGDMDVPEISPWVASALLDSTPARAEEVLDELFDAQLVEVSGQDVGGHTRYRLHDMVRLFAMERAGREEAPDALAEARMRVMGGCLVLATGAYRAIYTGDYQNIVGDAPRWAIDQQLVEALTGQPLQWFEADRQTIIAVAKRAAHDGCSSACWELACTTSPLFQMRRLFDDWQHVLDIAFAAADGSGDRRGKAAVLYRLGWLCTDRTDYRRARQCFQDSAQLFSEVGDDHGQATVTAYLGMIERFAGDDDASLGHYDRARRVLHDLGDRAGEAFALRGIGQIHLRHGEHAAAGSYFGRAIAIYQECGLRQGEAQVMAWQGMLLMQQERYAEAEAAFHLALEMVREIGDQPGEAQCLRHLGLCYRHRGEPERARETLSQALALVRQPRPTHLETRIREALDQLQGP